LEGRGSRCFEVSEGLKLLSLVFGKRSGCVL